MSNLVIRTERTADGLRDKLFATLDALIAGTINIEQVEAVCAISDQIIKTSKVELEIFQERERVAKEIREDELKLLVHKDEVTEKLKGVIDVIETQTHQQ